MVVGYLTLLVVTLGARQIHCAIFSRQAFSEWVASVGQLKVRLSGVAVSDVSGNCSDSLGGLAEVTTVGATLRGCDDAP